MRALVLALILAVSAEPALAQTRTPDQKSSLLALSYALGQSHAYRQACEGPADQYWRGRMLNLVDAEKADPAFEARMKGQFNSGFAAAQSAQPGCAAAHAQAASAAKRGAEAASALSAASLPASSGLKPEQ